MDSALDTVSALLGRLAVVDGPLGTLSALPGWMVVVDGPLGTLSAPVGWLAAVDGPLGALLAREAGDPPRSSKSLRESPQAGDVSLGHHSCNSRSVPWGGLTR